MILLKGFCIFLIQKQILSENTSNKHHFLINKYLKLKYDENHEYLLVFSNYFVVKNS